MAHSAIKREFGEAIEAFETSNGLHVTVHDLVGQITPLLPPERMRHSRPLCRMVKSSQAGWRCYDFEVTQLRRQWSDWLGGRVHRCHAGLIEWMVPMVWDGRLVGVAFAGQARGPASVCDLVQVTSSAARRWADVGLDRQRVTREEAAFHLENLRQLAARLLLLMLRVPGGIDADASPQSRQARVQEFIAEHQHRPGLSVADLAKQLHLSPSRTGHLVSEMFGQSFGHILNAARMRHACDRLEHTDEPVADVGRAVGLPDPGHFHRVFKRHLGTTPGRYRREQQGP